MTVFHFNSSLVFWRRIMRHLLTLSTVSTAEGTAQLELGIPTADTLRGNYNLFFKALINFHFESASYKNSLSTDIVSNNG